MGTAAPNGVSAGAHPPSGDQANAVVTGNLTAIGPGDPFTFYGGFNIAIYGTINTALTTTKGSLTASVTSGTGIAIGNTVNSVNVPKGTTWKTFSGTSGTLALPAVTVDRVQTNVSAATLSNVNYNTSMLVGAAVSGMGIPAGTTVLSVITPYIPGNLAVPTQAGVLLISQTPTIATNTPQGMHARFALTSQAITSGTDSAALFTGSNLTYSATVNVERSFNGGSDWVICNLNKDGVLSQFTAGTPVNFVIGECERGVMYRINCIAYTSGTIAYRMSASGGAAMSEQATSYN